MKISKIVCNIDSLPKVIEVITDYGVYDFHVHVEVDGLIVSIRVNNYISSDDYEDIKRKFKFETLSHLMDGVYMYDEDGHRLEIDGFHDV